MKIYRIPQKTGAIIFDIDGTLYTSPEYVHEQVDVQIRYYAKTHGMKEQEARDSINAYRKEWSSAHQGKSISLGNTLTAFGIPIETSIKWREQLLKPELYLKKNPELIETLEKLSKSFRLICLTNNPVNAARKTLAAIGADRILPDIIGLDTCMKSKPSPEMLELASKRTGVPFCECLSVGDRYDIDLALPLKMGMGAVEVTGAEDIITLSTILA